MPDTCSQRPGSCSNTRCAHRAHRSAGASTCGSGPSARASVSSCPLGSAPCTGSPTGPVSAHRAAVPCLPGPACQAASVWAPRHNDKRPRAKRGRQCRLVPTPRTGVRGRAPADTGDPRPRVVDFMVVPVSGAAMLRLASRASLAGSASYFAPADQRDALRESTWLVVRDHHVFGTSHRSRHTHPPKGRCDETRGCPAAARRRSAPTGPQDHAAGSCRGERHDREGNMERHATQRAGRAARPSTRREG